MLLLRLLLISWVCICGFAHSAVGEVAPSVGEVTFVVGVGRVFSRNEHIVPVTRGMSVSVGDRIETEAGGHVHIRFVDGAFVSVRPGSRLGIEAYAFDPAHPQDSAIRFKLEQGVVRAISGQGAQAARDRFRLNTPIAAIGVRGTDFVVQSVAEQVRVAVHSGAIVLAPFGEGCVVDALGPCASTASRLLSADMGQVVLEFQRQQAVPRIVPLKNAPSDPLQPVTPDEPRIGLRRNEVAADSVAAHVVESGPVQKVSNPNPPGPEVLAWGRWSNLARQSDTMTVTLAEASDGRNVMVGDDYYVLFRTAPSNAVIPSSLGRVDFSLRAGEAFLVTPSGTTTPGRVDGGWLSIDFGTAKFSTSLNVSHPSTGAVSVSAAGNVRDDGLFVARNSSTVVAGGVSVDGKQAAYLFQQQVAAGILSGITRWGR